MEITSFKFVEHLTPNVSCGTGYSEPEKFSVSLDNGEIHDLWVDIWYLSDMESVKKSFMYSIKDEFGDTCTNVDEAFEMYVKELPKRYQPPFWPK